MSVSSIHFFRLAVSSRAAVFDLHGVVSMASWCECIVASSGGASEVGDFAIAVITTLSSEEEEEESTENVGRNVSDDEGLMEVHEEHVDTVCGEEMMDL